MEAIWNRVQLERPPNATCRVARQKFDITKFNASIDQALKDLTSQELFHKEAAILSRLIYRMKIKFRNDKALKSMCKLNKALLKYLSLCLEKEYKNLKNYVEVDEKFVTLPSRQMVEFVLVKTQGFAKLMLRVEEVSKYSAYYLKCRINLGHAWSMALVAYSVVSRIWLLSRYLVSRSCTWYNDLYPHLKLLKVSGLPWLPADHELTSDLKSWLAVPWIDEITPRVPQTYGVKNTMFKLLTPRDHDSDEDPFLDVQDSYRTIKLEESSSHVENLDTLNSSVDTQKVVPNDDTGETIDRHSFNLNRAEKKRAGNTRDESTSTEVKLKGSTKKRASKEILTFDDVKSKSDLIDLLAKESYPGLDKLQWNMIKKKSKKLLDKMEARSSGTEQSVLQAAMKRIRKWI
ncbi:uncharacterized protein LOC108623790 [Ceratina calcarata]|uniref:Uncharacterized protein LOC108623790 n=1 Tax=Ceratina calcarata TaxID=156304 RepID=A0AAJ7IW43_9HYME|nr:uncharacterized protein LOC108623790 [Ceratina calcarata]